MKKNDEKELEIRYCPCCKHQLLRTIDEGSPFYYYFCPDCEHKEAD
jgi:hypothetical protein